MNKIKKDAHNRKLEISHVFSMLNESEDPLDKYFLARSAVVFTYGTMEKFVRDTSSLALKLALDNNYYNKNNIKELMQLLKYQNKIDKLFDVLMLHKETYSNQLEHNDDKSYFLKNGKMDSMAIAHVINVLNLNRFEPILKIPKLSIDTIANKRIQLAHGDYIQDLRKFSPSRRGLTLEEVNNHIEEKFRLNDVTRSDFLVFIDDFSDKILLFIEDIKTMKGENFKIGK